MRSSPSSAFASAVRCFSAAFAIQRDLVAEEEAAVLRHLLERLGAFALRQHDAFEQRVVLRIDAEPRQVPAQVRHDVLRLRLDHVLLVEPQQLLGIERRGRLVDVAHVEGRDHLVTREVFLVAMRPAEAHEIVEQRLG